jgi:Inner centromere protein, ARK binding region
MFVKTVTSQHQIQHSAKQSEMTKFANGRIPFAETAVASSATTSQTTASQSFKTPARQANGPSQTATAAKSAKSAKSSPRYPPSELIELPEIMTDSEDEDPDNEFQAPSWTESPALRQLLSRQQLVDPESIFGPVPPIRMEEVFAGSSREKKFRDRTSSAHWSNLDRLNEEERKKDRKARERLMKDGGWDFLGQKAALGDNSPRPPM